MRGRDDSEPWSGTVAVALGRAEERGQGGLGPAAAVTASGRAQGSNLKGGRRGAEGGGLYLTSACYLASVCQVFGKYMADVWPVFDHLLPRIRPRDPGPRQVRVREVVEAARPPITQSPHQQERCPAFVLEKLPVWLLNR
jgi:hypothetical protein